MSVHDHRRAAGISRTQTPSKGLFYYGNEELIFDARDNGYCVVEFDIAVARKDRDSQIFATFLNIKKTEIIESFSGDRHQRTPLTRLSLREIKQRIKDYKRIGKDYTQLNLAKTKCYKEYPPHQYRPT